MARKKKGKKSPSTYQKYGKLPFVYSHRKCSHKTEIIQSVPMWSGKVCSICNIITGVFDAK